MTRKVYRTNSHFSTFQGETYDGGANFNNFLTSSVDKEVKAVN